MDTKKPTYAHQFTAMPCPTEEGVSPELFDEAANHARQCHSLHSLVFGWVAGERKIRLCGGTNDDDGREGSFAVLELGRTEIASIWLEPSALEAEFPGVPPFDIDWEDFDAELGMTGSYFSMAVGHPVVNHRGSLLFSLSLLKTGLGDITFSELSAEDRLENCDECAETEGARLIWICFDLMWEDRRGCTHWMAYVFDRPETKVLNGSIGGSPAGCGHAANVS